MVAVVGNRPKLRPQRDALARIADLAGNCLRQLTAWIASIEQSPIQGKRHLDKTRSRQRDAERTATSLRLTFLQTLAPEHPLYATPEAIAARQAPPAAPFD